MAKTDADLLRDVLPRLHAKGIAVDLRCTCTSYIHALDRYIYKWTLRIDTEDVEIDEDTARTYAIGAMVEAVYESGNMHASAYVPSSLLADQLRIAERMGLIDPPTTTPEEQK